MSEQKEVKKQPSLSGDVNKVVAEQSLVGELQAGEQGIPLTDPKLIQLLLEERIESILEKRAERENKRRKQAARLANSVDTQAAWDAAIRRCNHKKGGKFTRHGQAVDYNLAIHTFILGETRVRCQQCPLVLWGPRPRLKFPSDSIETLYRENGNIANVSGLSFSDLMLLARNQSTNKETKSEQISMPVVSQDKFDELKAKLAEMEAQLAAFGAK